MALDDLAEGDADQVAVFVEHGVERVDLAQHAHDLELLLMQRIADEIALNRQRILHEPRRMEGADRLVMGDAGRDDLAPAGPAGHEMRLDQAGGDAQVGLDEAAVDLHRRAARRGAAEVDVVLVVARIMVLDPDVRQHPGIADEFGQLLAEVGAVQAGRDQDRRSVERNAGGRQVSIIGRRNSRLGTGRVMSQIRMQALRLPRASSASGAEPTGRSNVDAIARAGSASLGKVVLRMTAACAAAGSAKER